MRYSQGFRESILKKELPPESRSVAEVSRETGIAAGFGTIGVARVYRRTRTPRTVTSRWYPHR